jgi:hypothetical protein
MGSLCKLMYLTGPLSFPTAVAMGIVLQNNVRTQVTQVTLIPDDEIQMTSFTFDDDEFVPFESQLELGMNAIGDGHDLGIAVINDTDASKGETTTRFHPGAINGPFYELTYKILPD